MDGPDGDFISANRSPGRFNLAQTQSRNSGGSWGHLDGANDERTRFVAVLKIPPVDSAQKAVQVQIVKDVKEKE